MSYDPATVQAVCEFLRAGAYGEDDPIAQHTRYCARAIEREFPEAPAPEPSTDRPIEGLGPFGARALEAATNAVKASRVYAVSIPGEKYLFVAPEDEAYDVLAAAVAALDPKPSTGTLREVLERVERAARELDALFDPQNKGAKYKAGGEEEWLLDGRRMTHDASDALLSLHDCLNDAAIAREALAATPAREDEGR